MKKDSKIMKFYKSITDSEQALKRLPTYFFLICVLLICLIFKIDKTNDYLEEIAMNGTEYVQLDPFDKTTETEVKLVLTEEETVPHALQVTAETSTKNETNTTAQKTTTTTNTLTEGQNNEARTTYVINKSSKKIHKSDCSFVKRMNEENKLVVKLTKDEYNQYINNGYTMCSSCGG